MKLGIIGRKVGMTQIFEQEIINEETGSVNYYAIPVTVIEVENGTVIQVKTKEKDGYSAIKVGYHPTKRKLSKPVAGQFPDNIPVLKYQKEFRIEDENAFKVGDTIGMEVLEEYPYVDVRGKTKGKGFQGVVKRWGFSRGPSSHGSQFHRRPGAIGQHTWPAKIWKGKKLPGHTGNEKICIQNLEVKKYDKENKLLLIKGAVPGPNNETVFIIPSIKKISQEKGKKIRQAKAEGKTL